MISRIHCDFYSKARYVERAGSLLGGPLPVLPRMLAIAHGHRHHLGDITVSADVTANPDGPTPGSIPLLVYLLGIEEILALKLL